MTLSDTSPLPIPATGESPAADPFLALLTKAESADAMLSTSVPALASLTTNLVDRNNEWVQQASSQVASFRSALLARKTRVLDSAKRLSRKQYKRIFADLEAADVSTEQLRVWAGVAGAGAGVVVCPDLPSLFAASPLLALLQLAQAPVAHLSSIFGLSFADELGSVVTGVGLLVVSAAGPGLKWFDPHSRNEFSVVLAQADGSVPMWLTAGDVAVSVSSPGGTAAAAGEELCSAAAVRSEWVRPATFLVAYGGLSEDAPEALLRLSACGAAVADAAGGSDWSVRVPRKSMAGHACAAVGTHVRTLVVVDGDKGGMAVSADEKCLVVGLFAEGTLSVYSLPEGEFLRTFGGCGDGPVQFSYLRRLCFASNGNLIVVDCDNQRLQEVTLEGIFVRFIGVGDFGDAFPYCVAMRDDVISVGCAWGDGPRVVLFDGNTGAVTSRFGEVGIAPGHLGMFCVGIRFTPDGNHVIVAFVEDGTKRLSMFTTAGVFVSCVGMGVLGGGNMDVMQSVCREYVVADCEGHRVCVFSPDGSMLLRSWGVRGTGDGQFQFPTALAAAGKHLYVMDSCGGRVQVFE